ncbi:unnamed protein product [Schistocephalus solidus]|uniref:HAUS augmin-like complex subunit 6 n=1 Tax=Schistocephalus solidus TaxID=70667 RepID=A0A183TCX4_SCHSO|nr:unnamed protein product [Schistocephalus solidus]
MQPAQQSLLGDSGILAALQANIAATQNAVCEIAVGLRVPALKSWKFPHRLALSLPIGQLLNFLRYDPASIERNQFNHILLLELLDQLNDKKMCAEEKEEPRPHEQSVETWENSALDKETQTAPETMERIMEVRDFIEFFPTFLKKWCTLFESRNLPSEMGREYVLCTTGLTEMGKLPFVKLRRALDCDIKRLQQSLAHFTEENARTESRFQATLQELEKTQSTLASSKETFRKTETALKRSISDLKRQMEEMAKRVSAAEQNCFDLSQKLRNSEDLCKVAEAELNSVKCSLDRVVAFVFNPSKEPPTNEIEKKVVNAVLNYQLNEEKTREVEALQKEKLDRERQSALENKTLLTENDELRAAVSHPNQDHSGCKEKLADLQRKLQLLVEYPDLNASPEKPEKLR